MIHNPISLQATCEVVVRFKEADPMGVVWHGHYIQYFEDGREAFSKKYDIGYAQASQHGYTLPIVKISCDYKKPLRYGDIALVEATYLESGAAKIDFQYKIFKASDRTLVATGHSTQVFVDQAGALQLLTPAFALQWKKNLGLI
jgi:acyl-CoA thioester hydrolase